MLNLGKLFTTYHNRLSKIFSMLVVLFLRVDEIQFCNLLLRKMY